MESTIESSKSNEPKELNVTNRQPRSFYVLFFTEMWERFGYYGMQALLVLYLIKVFLLSDHHAYATFGAFSALVYATPVLGGFVADKLLGYHRTLIIGASTLTIGYFMLALPNMSETFFYLALGVIVIGNGFFKTSPSSLLGKSYGPNDPRIDNGYTLFYMSINIGSLLSMLLCGYIAKDFGWNVAFGVAAFGMALGLLTFLIFRKEIKHIGSEKDFEPMNKKILICILSVALVLAYVASLLLNHLTFTHWTLIGVGISALLFYAILLSKSRGAERSKLLACLILTTFAIMFYCLYFQAPESMNLFIDRNVDHYLFGIYIPTPSFQSLNPGWILILAPILSTIYTKLQKRNLDLSIPSKFAAGIIIMGLGFLSLRFSADFANAGGQVSAWWIVLSFFLYSLGELLVSALGLSMIAQLAPPRFLAIMMGTWFLASAAAGYLSGQLASLASIPENVTDPHQTLFIYAHVFAKFGWISIAVGILGALSIPFLKRLMGLRN